MKAQRYNSTLFNLVARWGWMANDTARQLHLRETNMVPIIQEAG
jgi:hypothetical protein